MRKTFCLDTNVLLSDGNAIYAFDDNDLVIPMVVLEELDAHKARVDEVGRNARHVSRMLDEMRKKGSLINGVELPNGGKIRIAPSRSQSPSKIPSELNGTKVDNLIIDFMMSTLDENAILVTKDINVRIKCDALGVKCEDYLKMRVSDDPTKLYNGVQVIQVDEKTVDDLYALGATFVDSEQELYPNQILVLKGGTKSAIARHVDGGRSVPVSNIECVFGLKPRNKEQNFSLDLLLNPDIKLVTLTGVAGTGKTLLALAAALEQLKTLGKHGLYERIIVTRPVQPVGRDIGFLPGTLEEKMEPWITPVKDNINFLIGGNRAEGKRIKKDAEPYLSLLQQRGFIEIEAITFIRGRSIHNSFVIIDEAQNLSMHELKTIVTRVGENTKIVLTGDVEQIDNVHVDVFTNGLSYAIERFKHQQIAGHVTLLKGERSALATIAASIL